MLANASIHGRASGTAASMRTGGTIDATKEHPLAARWMLAFASMTLPF